MSALQRRVYRCALSACDHHPSRHGTCLTHLRRLADAHSSAGHNREAGPDVPGNMLSNRAGRDYQGRPSICTPACRIVCCKMRWNVAQRLRHHCPRGVWRLESTSILAAPSRTLSSAFLTIAEPASGRTRRNAFPAAGPAIVRRGSILRGRKRSDVMFV